MIWIICFCAMLFSGCQQQSQERHYTEIAVEEPQSNTPAMPVMGADDPHAGMDMASMPMPGDDSAAGSNLFTWVLPKGWEQTAGKGFRLASFHLSNDAKAIDGSIVNLAGAAGGLEGNLRRWMGQIGMQTSDDDLSRLIKNASGFKIKSGQQGKVFDFTTVQEQGKPADKSMIVVMVEMKDSTLFIKMTGTIATVKKNKDSFLKLAGSVAPSTGVAKTKMPVIKASPVADMADPHAGLNMADPHAGMNMADPHSGMDMGGMGVDMPIVEQKLLAWDIPKDWKQVGGHPMRLGTFRSASDANAFDCSVILLGGEAGGLDSNLARWVGQLGLKTTPENYKTLTTKAQSMKTKGGLDVKIYDLTVLQGSPSAKGMMVGVLTIEASSVFVKITGTVGSLRKERESFTAFVGSLKRK